MPLATWSLFAPRALTQPSRAAAQRIITCFRTSRTSRRYKSSATAVATEDGFSEKEEEPIDVANLCQLLKDIPDEDTLANLVRDNPGTWRGVEKQLMESVDANGTCRAMEPTAAQLRLFAFGQFLPFLGFGFFDNAIMLLAGDFFDASLSAKFGISTLAAAGMGNIVGDVSGIWLSGTIEFVSGKSIPHHGLSTAQQNSW
eukprot:CAMPEP_0170167420 /NCGR_PEP_ID=MMETSP0040_2-20121228/825_1 /TAXON_ID=641309 /ORGANISM="Lotharella oceanica, Strain CCMP622" /LENGTH=199 /DNA_ID=CAMNT_0010405431 /DNA_START=816 /DNA_END=1412 /DNA_ORIENTATION=+